jgi:hypothetical protein
MAVSTIQNASLASGVPGYANLPAGSVLQVVNAQTTTETTTTSTTFSDTTLTATITPKFATSKILVVVVQSGLAKAAGNGGSGVAVKLLRGATDLTTFARAVAYTGVSNTLYAGAAAVSYLDSPATTSATTYKTQFGSNSSGGNIYVQINDQASTITLMEIAA